MSTVIELKLSTAMKKTLIALRAGEMDSTQLADRFDNNHQVWRLIDLGLVVLISGLFRLTPLGRQVCPNRRDFK